MLTNKSDKHIFYEVLKEIALTPWKQLNNMLNCKNKENMYIFIKGDD